ncbi:MAG: PcfJ domain-containing protein [Bacteroidaceae bacterium]|nr:PcfJ domain-containing protein [Bacteroidaceae bacterium]
MHHCVFSNAYYDVKNRPYCLILSAKVAGERVETIEVDLKDYSVIQSRGKHNQSSPYHERILQLMNSNMWQIKNLNKARRPSSAPRKAVAV